MSERLDSIADELLALRTESGTINAREAVGWARNNPGSQLHNALTWDDQVAGERYRVIQMRDLISIHIKDDKGNRRFVSLSIDRAAGGYREVSQVMDSDQLREVLLSDALDELERVRKRYEALKELQEVWVAAHRAAEKMQQRTRKKAA